VARGAGCFELPELGSLYPSGPGPMIAAIVKPPLWIELPAVIAGVLAGALFAQKRGLDLIGILALGLVTGLGGGILRDVLLGRAEHRRAAPGGRLGPREGARAPRHDPPLPVPGVRPGDLDVVSARARGGRRARSAVRKVRRYPAFGHGPFGQQLDPRILRQATGASATCNVFLAVGTSLHVAPAGRLPTFALEAGARLVIVNGERVPGCL
jgi:Glycine transporter